MQHFFLLWFLTKARKNKQNKGTKSRKCFSQSEKHHNVENKHLFFFTFSFSQGEKDEKDEKHEKYHNMKNKNKMKKDFVKNTVGCIAQPVEHRAFNLMAAGSSPATLKGGLTF